MESELLKTSGVGGRGPLSSESMTLPNPARSAYLPTSARALSKVAPALEAKIWADYKEELDAAISEGGAPAWPKGCNRIDIIEDKLFTNLPYMQGAFFYKDVAAKVGVDVLDGVIGRFYKKFKNKPASMQDMVDAIKRDTGFDPKTIVDARLRKQF